MSFIQMSESDLLVTCPYNPAHRIRRYKFQTHLLKCKKSSKNAESKVECPLDKNHVVDHKCLEAHIATCTSKGKLIELDTGLVRPQVNAEPSIMENLYDSTENWDEDPEVPAYNPMEVSAKKPVIRMMPGLTKSQKRKFKENERMRIANLKGVHSTSVASSSIRDISMKETHEVPLRPPRDAVSPTRVLRDDFNESVQIQDRSDNHDASMQASYVPEFQNKSFHTKLYDELVPDNIKQLELSLRNTEMDDEGTSLPDYFQHVSRDEANFSFSDRRTKVNKTEVDATSELFNVDKKMKDEYVASTSSVSGEQVTNKLLTLLKNDLGNKDVEPVKETVKVDEVNKGSGEKGRWDEIYDTFNKRLTYLTNIQNAAANESALLLAQLKELKLREEIASKK